MASKTNIEFLRRKKSSKLLKFLLSSDYPNGQNWIDFKPNINHKTEKIIALLSNKFSNSLSEIEVTLKENRKIQTQTQTQTVIPSHESSYDGDDIRDNQAGLRNRNKPNYSKFIKYIISSLLRLPIAMFSFSLFFSLVIGSGD